VTTQDWSAVVVAAVPYDGTAPLGCWQLSRVLGRRRPLLYVEPPHSVAHGLRLGPVLRDADDGVHVLTPTAPPAYDRRIAGDFADLFISRQISKAARNRLEGRLAMFVCTPRRGLLDVPKDVLLYWQRDAIEMLSRRGNAHRLERRHQRLLKAADIVTGVSPDLVARSVSEGRDAFLVPNGCDFEHFAAPQIRPSQLPVDRVIVGFGGGVSDRVDVDLLMALADARPSWLFVVVGEIARELPQRNNVRVVGRRPYWEMPAWLQAFDVGIIPYIEDTQNLHSNPLKALEYLAAGTPVVSVPINGLGEFGQAVRLASGADSFRAALDDVLARPIPAEVCREVARQNSWGVRVDRLEELVEQHLGVRRRGGANAR
jgi:glycosyltransferase involved in cell wall biosynthesis